MNGTQAIVSLTVLQVGLGARDKRDSSRFSYSSHCRGSNQLLCSIPRKFGLLNKQKRSTEPLKQSDRIVENVFGLGRSLLQEFVSPVKALNTPEGVTFYTTGNKPSFEWTTELCNGILK